MTNYKWEEYLRKAEDADQQAKRAIDPDAAAAWRRVSDSYRDLARLINRTDWNRTF